MFYIEHSNNCKVYSKCANKIFKKKKVIYIIYTIICSNHRLAGTTAVMNMKFGW